MNNLNRKYILLFSILINSQSTYLNNDKIEEINNLEKKEFLETIKITKEIINYEEKILEKLESFKIHHEGITKIMNIIKEKNLNEKELSNLFYFLEKYTSKQILVYKNAYIGIFYETEYILEKEIYKNKEKIKFISDKLLPIIYNLSRSNEVFINMSYYANSKGTKPLKVIKEIHENDLFDFIVEIKMKMN